MAHGLTWSELGLGLAVVLLSGWVSVLLERNRRLRSGVRTWKRMATALSRYYEGVEPDPADAVKLEVGHHYGEGPC